MLVKTGAPLGSSFQGLLQECFRDWRLAEEMRRGHVRYRTKHTQTIETAVLEQQRPASVFQSLTRQAQHHVPPLVKDWICTPNTHLGATPSKTKASRSIPDTHGQEAHQPKKQADTITRG